MTTEITLTPPTELLIPEKVAHALMYGDLSKLTIEEKKGHYLVVCRSVGLNPLMKPFEYIRLNGKEILYGNKGCAEQLRSIHKIAIVIVSRELTEDIYVVTARATKPDGRTDESIGAVWVGGKKGEDKANAFMKAETKAKRRVTFSICGLNMLDESEVDDIPPERKQSVMSVPTFTEIRAMPPKIERTDTKVLETIMNTIGADYVTAREQLINIFRQLRDEQIANDDLPLKVREAFEKTCIRRPRNA